MLVFKYGVILRNVHDTDCVVFVIHFTNSFTVQ